MSFFRIAVPGQPLRFVDQGPSSALVRHRGFGSEPVETVGNMRIILTSGGNYIENRTRRKPNNPFSIHQENRR